MKMNVSLRRKAARIEAEPCVVEDILELGEKHYGLNHVEPLFGEHPALEHQYMQEAEATWEQKWNSEQAQEEGTAPVLSM